MIDFFSFVASVQKKNLPHDISVFCLTGKVPVYFFSHLFTHTDQSSVVFEKIFCNQEDISVLSGKLQTTFLGQTCIYWLFGIEEMAANDAKYLLQFLVRYQGPHKVIMVLDESSGKQFQNSSTVHIVIPHSLSKQEIDACIQALYPTQAQALQAKIRASKLELGQYTLDDIAMLLSYLRLIGASVEEFNQEWYPKLVAAESSLFTLSTHFFGQQHQQFFQLWRTIQDDYPVQFWIAFFSEQLIKAYGFILYSRSNNHSAAKKIGYRLPFSFMRSDWKRYTASELARMHDALYRMDHHIKNGGTEQFDLLFAQFFVAS